MVINENSILYFSGTGNTYDVAEKVAKESELKLINISDLLEEEIVKINCEVIGLVFPIYFGGVPKIMNMIINKMADVSNVWHVYNTVLKRQYNLASKH